MAFEILLRQVIALPIIFFLCYFVYSYLTRKPNLPDLQWVAIRRNQWFVKIRARFPTTFLFKAAIEEAYEQVSFPCCWSSVSLLSDQHGVFSTPKKASHASFPVSLA